MLLKVETNTGFMKPEQMTRLNVLFWD